MSFDADKLYNHLPAIYRLRDGEQGNPLRELIGLMAEQIAALEENLDQLYDDQFIETCAAWVAPYIGDLIGYRALHGVAPRIASPRADVANTIGYRRRKGTATMLEQLAHDVTGWPARVVEFFQLLGWTQYMNYQRPDAHYAPDMRRQQLLDWQDSPFDRLAHTVEVRRVVTGSGRYNIPNIGIYLWRVRDFPLTRAAVVADPLDATGRLLRFNPLGADMRLFGTPDAEDDISHLAEPFNVPLALERRWLKAHLAHYYGRDRSLCLELEGVSPGDPPELVTQEAICVCDLSDLKDPSGTVIGWAHVPVSGSGKVAIDPVLGRIAWADPPTKPVLASCNYGFTLAIGGGEYERGETESEGISVRPVSAGGPLQPELDAVQGGGTVEILDSATYAGGLTIKVAAGKQVSLRAANGARPLIAGGDLTLDLAPGATFTLDGVVVAGGTVMLPSFPDTEPRRVTLLHSTLLPGGTLNSDGTPAQPGALSLVIEHSFTELHAAYSMTGTMQVAEEAKAVVHDCIIDATDESLAAYGGTLGPLSAGGAISLERCTVIGKLHAKQITLASDTLFIAALAASGETWKAPIWAERRQSGCIRFSYVSPGSLTPRRFHCQPERSEVRPHFTSLRYGTPGYCQLRRVTSDKIRRGAHDESEIGVMHDLFQPQREANLRERFDEYLRFGLEAGIFYVS